MSIGRSGVAAVFAFTPVFDSAKEFRNEYAARLSMSRAGPFRGMGLIARARAVRLTEPRAASPRIEELRDKKRRRFTGSVQVVRVESGRIVGRLPAQDC